MSKIKDGGPAFPSMRKVQRNHFGAGPGMGHFEQIHEVEVWSEGITIRDYFAAKAMLGMITGSSPWTSAEYKKDSCLSNIENDAKLAYKYAEAMLRAREVQP